ncbi:unnamed protein product [Sphenostylis stenocarpa]|uniref:Uncharacterized protein n=1 Tax=Sphenostylis stenocarpa TaxID=92480 RepID=A0AA86SMI9_9FABA|nr:unnamed protein product [Sphenostylis stenocarpa]
MDRLHSRHPSVVQKLSGQSNLVSRLAPNHSRNYSTTGSYFNGGLQSLALVPVTAHAPAEKGVSGFWLIS